LSVDVLLNYLYHFSGKVEVFSFVEDDHNNRYKSKRLKLDPEFMKTLTGKSGYEPVD
jgi:hypothetical protein